VALRTVFLDAGGVLVVPNWTRVSSVMAGHGVNVSAAALAAADPHARRQLDRTLTVQTTNDSGRGWLYFDLVLQSAGVQISERTDAALAELQTYHRAQNLWEHVPDNVFPALRALRSRRLHLTVVSNANGTLCACFDRLGLAACVDCVLDSCDVGVEKPDPRFFTLALERSGGEPATTIHVGDIYHIDVVGARGAGIRPVLLDEAGLYEDADCTRIRSLGELVGLVDRGEFDS
jgi:HAD superfamily hydrolase (TIGR01509 family)